MRCAGAIVLVACCVALPLGCSNAPTFSAAESEQAKEALATALMAWQRGQAGNLNWRRPPIRFVDDDWTSGCQLLKFELQDPTVRIQPYQSIAVRLQLRTPQGKLIERHASYQVALSPQVSVMRDD